MSSMLEQSKLGELRAKTDRELSRLVVNGVGNALTLVRVAEAHYSLGDFSPGESSFRRASENYWIGKTLLPLVRDLSPEDRANVERKLVRLRRELDSLAVLYGALDAA